MNIRSAHERDLGAVALLHVEAWRSGYRGLLPDETLSRLSVREREVMWRETLGRPRDERVFLVAESEGTIRGFTVSERRKTVPPEAEVVAVYVEPRWWRMGVGLGLMIETERRLRALGFRSAWLWVMESNERARRFYHGCGWRPDGAAEVAEFEGVACTQVRYRLSLEHPRGE